MKKLLLLTGFVFLLMPLSDNAEANIYCKNSITGNIFETPGILKYSLSKGSCPPPETEVTKQEYDEFKENSQTTVPTKNLYCVNKPLNYKLRSPTQNQAKRTKLYKNSQANCDYLMTWSSRNAYIKCADKLTKNSRRRCIDKNVSLIKTTTYEKQTEKEIVQFASLEDQLAANEILDLVNYCINIPKRQKQITSTACPSDFWRVGKVTYDKNVYNQYVELNSTTVAQSQTTTKKKDESIIEKNEDNSKYTEQTVIVQNDTTGPEIIVSKTFVANQNMTVNIKGRVEDDSKIVSLTIDGDQVTFTQGRFNQILYVLPNGQDVEIIAIDKFGNQSKTSVTLERATVQIQTVSIDKLNPLAIKTPINNNAVALIIGIEEYENTFKAAYAKQDALFFNDFAHQAFGVPRYNIKLLTNTKARRNDTLLQIATWLPKVIKEHKTDFYLFFSGHGLASANGEDLFLLPYDGNPEILEDSSLLRNKIFTSIAKLNPKSVTVFLDTCYSGATRSNEMLVAARPIFIEVAEQKIPNNFTVFSASANNEIANVLKEAEHGLFSYYLMKGLEGEADSNNDQQITNGELIAFINKQVSRQANQTPQLSGDPNQVLVQW